MGVTMSLSRRHIFLGVDISQSNVSKFAVLKHFGCDCVDGESRCCLDISEFVLKCVLS